MKRFIAAVGLAVGLAACVASNQQSPQTSALHQAELSLPIPAGYCQLSQDHPMDREMLELTADLNATHNRVLAMFADCGEIEKWRADGLNFSRYGLYLSPLSSEGRRYSMSRATFIDQISDQYQRMDAVAMVEDEMKQRFEQAEVDVELQDMVNLGLLGRDDSAAYIGVLQRVSDSAGTTASVAAVSGLTLINGQVVTLNLSTSYEGKRTIEALLAEQRSNVRSFIDAN